MTKFEFDFGAVSGMPFEQGAQELFRQMEKHYNEHIQPKPYIFGADPAKPGADRSVETEVTAIPAGLVAPDDKKLVRVKPGWEVKDASTLGLKEGNVLVGVNMQDVEIFDYVKNYKDGDVIADGESAKYDLSAK